MAKSQTRRSVSLNRDVYVVSSKYALRTDVTLSQLTTEALREYLKKRGVSLPDVEHVPVEIAERAATAIRHGIVAREERRYSGRVTDSYRLLPGPVRKALGDAAAEYVGEPMRKVAT